MYTGRWTAVARLVFVTCQAIDRIFPLARSSILENPGSPSRGFLFDGRLSIGDGEAGADGQGSELVDRVGAGARQLLLVEELGHFGCHSPGSGRNTAPGSSSPQSTRIVQRKRRPTSNVDSMMVLRARRGGTGSK